METQERQTIADKVVNGLRNAAAEIEELQVQMALGKAEAKDLYEKLKKNLSDNLHQTGLKIRGAQNNEKIMGVVNAVQHLQVQLALGLAETRSVFDVQRKKITDSLNALEAKLKANDTFNEYYPEFRMELEMFRVKLELLSLHYQLDKIKAKFVFEQKKQLFFDKLEDARTKIAQKEKVAEQHWEHFTEELNSAFGHFKKAFNFNGK